MKKTMWTVAAGLMLTCGCATAPEAGESLGEVEIPEVPPAARPACEAKPLRLSDRVKVVRVSYGDNGDGVRNATITLQSRVAAKQTVQMRLVWFDDKGRQSSSDDEEYLTVDLDGAVTCELIGSAPNARCVRAKVQLRNAREVEQ